jgi:pimeloyl-ACP methyl ester carboxylesterase
VATKLLLDAYSLTVRAGVFTISEVICRWPLAIVVVVLALAGCTTAGGPPREPSGRSASASPVPESAAGRCGGWDAASRPLRLASSGGAVLDAYETGSGSRGVVLVPELGRRNLCGWWSYAAYLASRGLRVLIFDHQCAGRSTCPATRSANALMDDIAAGVMALHRDGAQRIVLVGASQGGAEVVIAGAHPPVDVVGVVAISADGLTDPLTAAPYPETAATAARLLALPSLFVVAANDRYVSVVDTQALVSTVPSGTKRVIVVPASQHHGWDLFDGGAGQPPPGPSDDVVAFLTEVLP